MEGTDLLTNGRRLPDISTTLSMASSGQVLRNDPAIANADVCSGARAAVACASDSMLFWDAHEMICSPQTHALKNVTETGVIKLVQDKCR